MHKIANFTVFYEFSNAEKCFLHMTVTALFFVSPPTVDGSHDFLLFLMFYKNSSELSLPLLLLHFKKLFGVVLLM